MYEVNGNAIKLTRGDSFVATITIMQGSVTYVPAVGDRVFFYLKRNRLNAPKTAYVEPKPTITKEIPTDTLMLTLAPDDTDSLDFGEYVYDIKLLFADGSVDTFIAQAPFTLLPEAN